MALAEPRRVQEHKVDRERTKLVPGGAPGVNLWQAWCQCGISGTGPTPGKALDAVNRHMADKKEFRR
jgi:hypothetical protein